METNIDGFCIRFAQKKDAGIVLQYIRDLASYENELDEVTCTPELLEKYMFDQGGA